MNAETRLEKRLGFRVADGYGKCSLGCVTPAESEACLYPTPLHAAALWNELLRLERENEWIPVSERLPERGVLVLVYTSSERIDTDAVNVHDGKWECDDDWTVTHWRPLPQPPEREK